MQQSAVTVPQSFAARQEAQFSLPWAVDQVVQDPTKRAVGVSIISDICNNNKFSFGLSGSLNVTADGGRWDIWAGAKTLPEPISYLVVEVSEWRVQKGWESHCA